MNQGLLADVWGCSGSQVTDWLQLQVSLALALRKWDSVAYPWRCLFWDSADLERIEAGNSKNRASGETATTTLPLCQIVHGPWETSR